MRRRPRWSRSEEGPLAHAARAPLVPKRKRSPRPCGAGLPGPKAKDANSPMRRCVGVDGVCVPSCPHRAPLSLMQPKQDRRDSSVSAAAWGWMVYVSPHAPTGRPCPQAAQAGPEGLGCIHRCVGVDGVRIPSYPHGAPLSLMQPRQDRRGSGVSAALWRWMVCVSPHTPRGAPIPHAAEAGPAGLGCIRRCVGVDDVCVPLYPHRAPLSLMQPRQDRRDSGVSAAVWGWMMCVSPCTPTGRPYPQAAQAGPEGFRCIRRAGGADGVRVPSYPHGAPLSPKRPRQDRRGSGVSTAVWGWMMCVSPFTPTGRPYPSCNPGRTGGTRVYLSLCGGG